MRGLAGLGVWLGYERGAEVTEFDAERIERAKETAEEGARRLRAAGMDADALVEERAASIAETVLAVSERFNAEAVVAGMRGRGKSQIRTAGKRVP